jgi:hypothetical protein
MFAACLTCYDILYATQRLSEFNNNPTTITYQEFVRILRYLAKDVICTLMFPRELFSKSYSVSY